MLLDSCNPRAALVTQKQNSYRLLKPFFFALHRTECKRSKRMSIRSHPAKKIGKTGQNNFFAVGIICPRKMSLFVPFLFAILDLVSATAILMRGWNWQGFFNIFKTYTVTDSWDLWVLAVIRNFIIFCFLLTVRCCSWKPTLKRNKRLGVDEILEDAAASSMKMANMALISIMAILLIGITFAVDLPFSHYTP
jgi:hypothetical protein